MEVNMPAASGTLLDWKPTGPAGRGRHPQGGSPGPAVPKLPPQHLHSCTERKLPMPWPVPWP